LHSLTLTQTALAYHYAQLQALAFEEDFDPATADLDRTRPKYAGIHTHAGDFMREWKRAIEEDERAVEGVPSKSAGTKRPAANVADIDVDDLADVRGAFQKGTLNKVSIGPTVHWVRSGK
jgi:ATP-dependent DNA helicase 2 subunit 1